MEEAIKTNSVTILEGITLAASLSSSFRSAPSRDYVKSILAMIPAAQEGLVTSVVGTR